MTEEKLWLLVSLQLSGEATPAELEQLEAIKQQNPHWEPRITAFEQLWHTRNAAGRTAMSFDKHLQRLSNHLASPALQFEVPATETEGMVDDNNKRRRQRLRWVWMGASAAACLVLFFLLLKDNGKEQVSRPVMAGNTVSTKAGSKSKIELPDGTQVWLNADSKLVYNGDFSGKTREVSLSGEAYFDVVKDKSRPFIIHTIAVQVKVLGTAFNVRSYPSDKTTETSLIRGSVEVTLNSHPDKKVILKPNEKVVIDNANATAAAVTADNPKITSTGNAAAEQEMLVTNVHFDKKDQEVYETMWVKNKLAFDETGFDDMIAALERWYNVTIIVKNKALSTGTYTVTFENKTLDEVLEGLQFSAHFQYQVKEGIVTIW